jgi:hypothetical protein
MKLQDILALKRGVPFSAIVGAPVSDAFISELDYRVAPGIYLSLSHLKPGTLKRDPDGPFLVGVLVAPDDGAAKRIVDMAVEDDAGAGLTVPDVMLPEGAKATYESILTGLKKVKPKVCLETGTYRIATDGLFVHRAIETPQATYYFRGKENNGNEAPFAVSLKHS